MTKPRMLVNAEMERERECKHSVRYKGEDKALQTIYIGKEALGSAPYPEKVIVQIAAAS